MIGNILLNLRYLFAPILIIVAGAGVLIGGMWAWTGVILLFVGLLVDIATKFETSGVGYDENGETRGWATFQNLTMYFMLPVFVLFQLVMAYRLYTFMALGGAPPSAMNVYSLYAITNWNRTKTGNMKYIVKFWKVAHPLVSPFSSYPTPEVSNLVAMSTNRPTNKSITPVQAHMPPIKTPAPATIIRIGANR